MADAPTTTDDDFLARERAALGEDADQFATARDHVGDNVGGDDDLLGGGDEPVEEIGQFESSFPSVETQNQNEVCIGFGYMVNTMLTRGSILARCSRWHNYWLRLTFPPYRLPKHPGDGR